MIIKDLKVGEYFKLKPNGRIYVRGEYNRSIMRYEYYDYDDVNNYHVTHGNRKVITEF